MSNNSTMPGTIAANTLMDPEGPDGEHRLTPYVVIGGPNQYSENRPSLQTASNLEVASPFVPIKRFTLAVAPLQDEYVNYPNSGGDKWMINLDNEQLYTASRDSKTDYGFEFGKPYVAPSPDLDEQCYNAFSDSNGAYSSPVPVQGLPIEFRKVYFRGNPVDEYGKVIGCSGGSGSSGVNAYYAYFACSRPILQSCTGDADDPNGGSGCLYNPRNENFGIVEGEVADWESFDMGGGGGGGGGGGCSNTISTISGYTWAHDDASIDVSGCDGPSSTLKFVASGTATGTTSGDLRVSLGYHRESGTSGDELGPEVRISMHGLGHVFTGIKSTDTTTHNTGYHIASNRHDHIHFKGVSGIRTLVTGHEVRIGAPTFTASGCLNLTTTTDTNLVTYGLDRSGMINCLGYTEARVVIPIFTGEDDAYTEGPMTVHKLTGSFVACEYTLLYKCPELSDTRLTGCCVPDVGACCYNGNCTSTTEDACDGYYWGDGTNCSDQPSAGSAPYYNYTIAELCEEGIGCVYNTSPPGMGGGQIGYECYNGEFGGPTCSRKDYLDHVYSDSAYHEDEAAGVANPSTFEVGAQCTDDPYPCPTTSTTTTSTTSTSSTTTTPAM